MVAAEDHPVILAEVDHTKVVNPILLDKGILTRKVIKIGMVGDTYTQVVSGLRDGESVVLADYSQAVPSSNTDLTTALGGGTTGFGGFGGFGGGAGGFAGGAGGFTRTAGGGAGGFGG